MSFLLKVQAQVARVTADHEFGGLGMTPEGRQEWADKLTTLTLADRQMGNFDVWADEGVARGFAIQFKVQVSGFHAKAITR